MNLKNYKMIHGFKKKNKQLRRHFRKFGTWSTTGNWYQRAEFYMKKQSAQAIYSVFRREELKKCFKNLPDYSIDMAVIMSILKYGDIISLEETLWYYHTEGISSESLLSKLKTKKMNFIKLITSPTSFVKWSIQVMGIKFFLKNIGFFISLYLIYPTGLVIEIYSRIKNNIKKT